MNSVIRRGERVIGRQHGLAIGAGEVHGADIAGRDIAEAVVKKGINLDRRQIQLHEPLKTLGEFTVPVKLHKDVTAHLKVVIEKEAVAE